MDKKNFVSFGCGNLRNVGADVVQSLYSLTKILPQDEKTLSSNITFE